jgi:hypothetical protein
MKRPVGSGVIKNNYLNLLCAYLRRLWPAAAAAAGTAAAAPAEIPSNFSAAQASPDVPVATSFACENPQSHGACWFVF